MHQRKICVSVAMIFALTATGAFAQGAQRDQNHPGTTPPAPATTPAPTTQEMPMGSMPGGSGGMSMMSGMPMMGMMQMMMGQHGMAGHVEGRIAFLKTELKITEAQSPQWNQFAEALRSNARRMNEMRGMMSGTMSQGGATMSAPERLERMETMMTGMLESVRTTKAALTPLYDVLTDEQKKLADDLIRGPMGMMGSM
jgi:LTXXQ motif family protein